MKSLPGRSHVLSIGLLVAGISVNATNVQGKEQPTDADLKFAAPAEWRSSGVLVAPVSDAGHEIVSVKDPSVVFHDGKWHVYATTANGQGNWSIVYLSFADWAEAAAAKPFYIDQNPGLRGYHCAPQVFFFRPHNKWYLIFQSQQPQYSTADDLSKPETWTAPQNFFEEGLAPGMPRLPIDYWVICDDTHAYLFFTGDNGRLYRSRTAIEEFPHGMSNPVVAIDETRDILFEGSMTYKLKGMNKYLTLVEALSPVRFYRAFLADSLDGEWSPLAGADSYEQPFAGEKNVAFAAGVEPWTRDISHGELIRDGFDQSLTIDPMNLRLLFQGRDPEFNADYSQLPYRLGMLTAASSADQGVSSVHSADRPARHGRLGGPPVVWTQSQDHQDMMRQLGITKLRPGRSGNADSPNAANYDEEKAQLAHDLPDPLRLNSGQMVRTPDQWWKQRRPEIVEALEREIIGRVPPNAPSVRWEVRDTRDIVAGGRAAVEQHLVGVVDNSECPEIEVGISLSLTLPKDTSGPVPVLMSFGWSRYDSSPFGSRGGASRGTRVTAKQNQLLGAGWGCATLNPYSVQQDQGGVRRRARSSETENPVAEQGAGLTRGVIGLANQGQPRSPEVWGALRAWAWGASRALDYLGTEPAVDAERVGIAGVSRFGKAALVAMAFDQRFAMGLIASSGEGGTSLYRRDFGEAPENLAGSGAYHWMAGNFLKYSAEESSFGRKDAYDLPADAHSLLALCAPRPTFISHGIPERGDALWLDHQGSFMAAIAAQPVYRLLGARGLDRSDDYRSEKMPGVNIGLLDGQLAWRQHDGGHTDAPNIEHFVQWAQRVLPAKEPPTVDDQRTPARPPAVHVAYRRTDPNSEEVHRQLVTKTQQGQIDVYFQGDSITRRWGATDYPKLLEHWNKTFHGWNAANFAWGGDNTHNILWRMQNGELDGVSPKVVSLQAGTNNLPWNGPGNQSHVDDVVSGIDAIIAEFQEQTPDAVIVLTAVFPRTQNLALRPTIEEINEELAHRADGDKIRFVNINDKLADSDGKLLLGMSSDGLHLETPGYQVWADALTPILHEVLGPRAEEDHAPPPTGDPSARR